MSTSLLGEPLAPPRTTGDPQTDLLILVKYLRDLYEAITRTYLKQSQLGPDIQKTTPMLDAISPLIPAADKLMYLTGTTGAALATVTVFARSLLATTTSGDFVATLGLGLLSTKNTVSTTDIGDLQVTYGKFQNVSATDKLLGRATAGAGGIEEITCTATGRALIDDATTSDQRSTLGLGSLATKSTISTGDITDAQVTYAKIQNVSASDKILGRVTAGAGAIEEIACTTVGRNLIGAANAADQRTDLGLGSGLNVVITTASLTAFGATGSMTFINGVLTNSVQAT